VNYSRSIGPTIWLGASKFWANWGLGLNGFARIVPALVFVWIAAACSAVVANEENAEYRHSISGLGLIEQSGRSSVVITSESAEIQVPVVRVVAYPASVRVESGSRVALSAVTFVDEVLAFIGVDYVWSIEDSTVGAINTEGVFVAGSKAGFFRSAVTVMAIAENGQWIGPIHRSLDVEIIEPPAERPRLTRIHMFPAEIRARPGQKVRLVAIGYDQNGRSIPITRLDWSVDEVVGQIDSSGHFTVTADAGIFPSAIQVVASVDGTIVTSTGNVEVVVEADSHELRAQILPNRIQLGPGDIYRFVAVNSSNQPLGRRPPVAKVWSMANLAAGSISPDGRFRAGMVPGVYEDSVIVELTSSVEGGLERATSTATVIVLRPEPQRMLESIQINPGAIIMAPNGNQLLLAVVRDAGRQLASAVELEWELLDPRAGSIDSNGIISASERAGLYRGIVVVTARRKAGGSATETVSATADLIILGNLNHVLITPTEASVPEGGSVKFSALGFDENMVEIPGLLFRWRVLDDRVGTINHLGIFSADGDPGSYADVVEVTAIQSNY
jgi:hypothetical protein